MKKIATLFVLILSVMAIMALAASADAPIEIFTAEDLMAIEMDGNYKLVANIDLSDVEFTPIGTEEAPFTGVFDGNSKKISGLSFDTASKYIGLFGYTENSTIKNVVLENLSVDIAESELPNVYAAGICAYATGNSVFENCEVNGSIAVKSNGEIHAAGICAYVNSTKGAITNFTSCVNNASVTAESTGTSAQALAAGITSYGISSNITLSANNGDITAKAALGAYAAGISASYGYLEVNKCYNSASISATSKNVAAIAGGLFADSLYAIVSDSYNSGDVSASGLGDTAVGGICAESMMGNEYYRCYNAGEVSIEKSGLVGSFVATYSVWDEYTSNYVLVSEASITGSTATLEGVTAIESEQMALAETFYDYDFENVWYMASEGEYLYPMLRGFETTEEVIILGDLNGDQKINTVDYVIASRYVAEYEGYENFVNVENCDLDGDGEVTSIDAVILARYIANWTGYETIPMN